MTCTVLTTLLILGSKLVLLVILSKEQTNLIDHYLVVAKQFFFVLSWYETMQVHFTAFHLGSKIKGMSYLFFIKMIIRGLKQLSVRQQTGG